MVMGIPISATSLIRSSSECLDFMNDFAEGADGSSSAAEASSAYSLLAIAILLRQIVELNER